MMYLKENNFLMFAYAKFSLSLSFPPWVCYLALVSELSCWRAARSVDSTDKSNVKKIGTGADWTERVLAIKREMKTNGLRIVQEDGTK